MPNQLLGLLAHSRRLLYTTSDPALLTPAQLGWLLSERWMDDWGVTRTKLPSGPSPLSSTEHYASWSNTTHPQYAVSERCVPLVAFDQTEYWWPENTFKHRRPWAWDVPQPKPVV